MSCFIYAIGRSEGPIKIGISSQPWGRLATIQTSCPFPIDLLYTRDAGARDHALSMEEDVHVSYSEYRLTGEWFDIDVDFAKEAIDTGFEYEEYFARRTA